MQRRPDSMEGDRIISRAIPISDAVAEKRLRPAPTEFKTNYIVPNVAQFPGCDTELETIARKYTRITRAPGVAHCPKAFRAWFVVEHQYFEITGGHAENKMKAEWFCLQFAKAFKRMNQLDPEFARGVVWACARMIEMYDEPTQAISILNESGLGSEDLKRCAEYDLKFIRKEARPNSGNHARFTVPRRGIE